MPLCPYHYNQQQQQVPLQGSREQQVGGRRRGRSRGMRVRRPSPRFHHRYFLGGCGGREYQENGI